MNYLVGDVQGCGDALDKLLKSIDFSPSRDRIYLLGDLVNRGPASLQTLRKLEALGDAAVCLLGNHDLHLLAVACGGRPAHRSDTFDAILKATDRVALLRWLRHQRMAVQAHGWLMLHAGVAPSWSVTTTLALAAEVEQMLQSDALDDFLHVMYGNEPLRWDASLEGDLRLRFILNVLTRVRFIASDGTLDMKTKDGAGAAPDGFYPWFDVPGRQTAGEPIAFGHWSTLGLVQRADLLALDTGCVWGGSLTAARLADGAGSADGRSVEIIQVRCAGGRKP